MLLCSAATASAQLTIKAVGDVMLGSKTPRTIIPPDSGKAFVDSIAVHLKGADITFGNCEGTFVKEGMKPVKCEEKSRRAGRCYEFGMPPHLAKTLTQLGFTVMSLDNNHCEDYGAVSYKLTQDLLAGEGIGFAPKKGFAAMTVKGKKVAVVAFGFSDVSNQVSDLETAKKAIRAVRDSFDVVIASFHGGAEGKAALHVKDQTENFYGENRGNLVRFAHTVVDAGADMVIGHGPHVLRALELYKKKLVIYSLGNFLTYGNMGIAGVVGVGAIVEAEFDAEHNFKRGKIIPTRQIDKGYPVLDKDKEAVALMKQLTEEDFPNTKLSIDANGNITVK